MSSASAFAINFGMDRSWAAVVTEEGEVVLPARGIRSYVEFGKSEPTVGGELKESINAANSVYGFKRLLGRKYDDPVVQQEKKYLPVDVVANRIRAMRASVRQVAEVGYSYC
ncbi:heat shock protein 70 [Aphelenchoides avenae]|nr:heat shock protein 70 [Aphelenchus avenae]